GRGRAGAAGAARGVDWVRAPDHRRDASLRGAAAGGFAGCAAGAWDRTVSVLVLVNEWYSLINQGHVAARSLGPFRLVPGRVARHATGARQALGRCLSGQLVPGRVARHATGAGRPVRAAACHANLSRDEL